MATVAQDNLTEIIRLLPGYDPYATAADGEWFDEEAARDAIEFVEENCSHVLGELAHQRLILEPWQKAIFANLFGWKRADGTRRYREAFVFVPRKNSKALSLLTSLPTPAGWTTMGDVVVGERLYDDAGNQCTVTHVSDVQFNRPCYRVAFSDGTAIVADEDHLWETDARTDRDRLKGRDGKTTGPKPSIKTTGQIRDTLLVERRSVGAKNERNHRVRLAGPLVCSNVDLPIAPYVLGAWLGDGHSACARLTCSRHDRELIENIREDGVSARLVVQDRRSTAESYLLGSGGRSQAARHKSLHAVLRRVGLIDNKHIPPAYLRASQVQRMDLLAGLMDTDGTISKAGQCVFTSTRRRLAVDVLELVRSLGYKPTFKTRRAMRNGKDCGPVYCVQFWAFEGDAVFRLSRKARRLKPMPSKPTRAAWRQIVSVESVESVPVRCIQVDSPSHLFLAGDGMVPTHNTTMAAAIVLTVLYTDGEPGCRAYSAGSDREQAALCFDTVKGMVVQDSDLFALAKVYRRAIEVGADSVYRPVSSESRGQHGQNAHLIVIDELHAHRTRELTDTLMTGTGARRQPLVVLLSTSDYEREGSICNIKHEYACKVRDEITPDPAFLPVIYEARREDDWTDPEVWAKANPNLDVSIKREYLERECTRAQEEPEFENEFKRLHLNIRTEQAFRWMPMGNWDACSGKVDAETLKGKQCYAGLDLATVKDMAALVLCIVIDGVYHLLPFFWCPEESAGERERKERQPYLTWARQGYLDLTPGPTIDYALIRRKINELGEVYRFQEIAYDPWNATMLAGQLTDEDGFSMVEHRQGTVSMNEPMKAVMRLVLEEKIRHGGHPILRWNANNLAASKDASDNVRPDKEHSGEKIDGMVAAIMAVGRAAIHAAHPSVYAERGVLVI